MKDRIANKFNSPPPRNPDQIVIGNYGDTPVLQKDPNAPLPTTNGTPNRGIKPSDSDLDSEKLKLKAMGKWQDFKVTNRAKNELVGQNKLNAETEHGIESARTGLRKIFSRAKN
ncbi:MAG: hypothetical protein ACLPYS_03640 [Vulcanimicrobiaceae bacterium]